MVKHLQGRMSDISVDFQKNSTFAHHILNFTCAFYRVVKADEDNAEAGFMLLLMSTVWIASQAKTPLVEHGIDFIRRETYLKYWTAMICLLIITHAKSLI